MDRALEASRELADRVRVGSVAERPVRVQVALVVDLAVLRQAVVALPAAADRVRRNAGRVVVVATPRSSSRPR